MRVCLDCRLDLPGDYFSTDPQTNDGLHPVCRQCKRKSRGLSLRIRASGAYAWLLKLQQGVCFICRKPPSPGRSLDVDHDHHAPDDQLAVRGLLCRSCNRGLGMFADNAEYLSLAEQHLLNRPLLNWNAA